MKASVATTAGLSAQRSLLKAVEELVLNMLAELSTTSITKAKDPQNLEENMQCAAEGGEVARVAREQLELKTGRDVVSPLSAKRFFEAQQPTERLGEAEEE